MSFLQSSDHLASRLEAEQSALGFVLINAGDDKIFESSIHSLKQISWYDYIHREIFNALSLGFRSPYRINDAVKAASVSHDGVQIPLHEYLEMLEQQALGYFQIEELVRIDAKESVIAALDENDFDKAGRAISNAIKCQLDDQGMKILNVEDLMQLAPQAWLIESYIPEHSVCTLYGESGSYKSFVALDMCLSIATGKKWGQQEAQSGKIVYIAGEGASGVQKRLLGWLSRNNTSPEDISDTFFFLDRAVDPASAHSRERLIENISQIAGSVDLIVFDTLARCMTGDENSQRDMNAFIAGVDEIKDQLGCSILLVHHTGYSSSERERGSSVLRAAVDTSIMLKRGSADFTAELTVQKQKDDGRAEKLLLKGAIEDLGDGVTTLVFDKSIATQSLSKRRPLSSNQLQVKRLVAEVIYRYGEERSGEGYPDASVKVITAEGWKRLCKDEDIKGGMRAYLEEKFPDISNPVKTVTDIVQKGYLAKHAIDQAYWVITE